MSKSIYNRFKQHLQVVTDYYMLLVEETKSKRQVGSTNEWVLDNYYMLSEQEKVLRVDLRSRLFRRMQPRRLKKIERMLLDFLDKSYCQVDKHVLFDYIVQMQKQYNDYLTYDEISLLLPLMKELMIERLSTLCAHLRSAGTYKADPADASLDAEHLDQAAKDNLLMMNLFNSLKRLTKLQMSEVYDRISFSEKALCKEAAGMYDQMTDVTKSDYRAQIVRQAKKAKMAEYDYVKMIVEEADRREEHVGWQLFPPKAWNRRAHTYVWIVVLATVGLSALFAVLAMGVLRDGFNGPTSWGWWVAMGVCFLLMIIPMSQIVIDLFNYVLYRIHKPRSTFKLKFKDEVIPDEYATMVIMPTILKNGEKTRQMLEQLEVYYLSNGAVPNLYFTLIGDASAQQQKDMPFDQEIVDAGLEKVRELNEKYGRHIFNFVYRNRFYSDGEGCWLGFERKRGAILHFNDLLLGHLSEQQKKDFFRCQTIDAWRAHTVSEKGSPVVVADHRNPVTFVITLDTDTELVLYSAQKLIGSMAHPLNRAILSPDGKRVDKGYGIMQPRVNVDVEVTNKSRYAQLFSGLGGLDVYTTASFELYQDIFDEGSFCGKGIYDLAVFQKVLKGTFPQNLILSHDLIEGCHIRCGLINDVELFDDSPSNYLDDAKRHHRWCRGDWQITPWLRNTVRNEAGEKVKNQVNTIGRWKIFDNLRRSVFSLSLLLALLFGFAFGDINPVWFLLLVLVALTTPIVFFIVSQITHLPRFNRRYRYYMTLMRGVVVVLYKAFVSFALLPKEAYMYSDAIIRACYRMVVSHKNLLNWVPSDEAAKSTKGTLADYCQKFWFNYVAAIALAAICIVHLVSDTWTGSTVGNGVLIGAALFTIVSWIMAPVLMFVLGKRFPQDAKHLSAAEQEEVRKWAKDTWHFFESMVSEETNYLIPDNYQLTRENKSDYKTSPTNIGYSLTALIAANELGFTTTRETVRRLGRVIETVTQLPKWNGHLYNWYHIQTLKALPNFFISTADSGNFVACLYVVKGYLEHLLKQDLDNRDRADVSDVLSKVVRLIDYTDFSRLYNHELNVFSIGYDTQSNTLLPYHYNNFASDARLTSDLTIARGDAPFKHWFCLDKTLVQFRRYKGVASWYGTMFEYFMPLIFLPTYKHTLMDETYSFAILAQRQFIRNVSHDELLPWGISETAYHELDDAQNYKYHAFGVPYLKFQNTTPDRIVISPYSSLLAISVDDRSVYDNMQIFKRLGMYDEYGFYESYDEEDHQCVRAHYAHHQGMILASLANYLSDPCLQRYFEAEPQMRAKETLLKEKVQVRPYIDLQVTKYKRYQYDKTQVESDAREYSSVANVPEAAALSNGSYTVVLDDRGGGFSRYKNVQINRYRKVGSGYYGQFLYIRNLQTDQLWCNTYAPLAVQPDKYRVTFASDRITYMREDNGIETLTEVTVVKDRNAEIRRFTFENHTGHDVDLELTTYGEVILCPRSADEAHRVFNGMTVNSEFDRDNEALIFTKPAREHVDATYFMVHKFFVDDANETSQLQAGFEVQFETSRLRFLGRGNSTQHAEVIETHQNLSRTVGTTLDPIMSMRRRVHVKAGRKARAYLIVGFGKSREQLIRMVQLYRDAFSISNAFEMATVYSNMRTAMSLLKGSQMSLYNTIFKYLLHVAVIGNERQRLMSRNTLSQSGLWRFGVSGDLAILLLEINNLDKASYAKEILQAYEYFKMRGMHLDVVIINDEQGERRDMLTRYIMDLATFEHISSEKNPVGRTYVINGSDLSEAERILFHTVARVSLTANTDLSLEEQMAQKEAENQCYQDKEQFEHLQPLHASTFNLQSLNFYNQYGGFTADGREYVVTNPNTPMPWVNVLSNPRFGSVISSTMSGFTFVHNAQQFKLTSWSNDIVRDPASEMLLIDRRQFVPTLARHGQGYSVFEAEYAGYRVSVRVFVASEAMAKYYQVSITNKLSAPQTLHVNMAYKLVMGTSEESTARYLHSEWHDDLNTLYVRNVYHETYRNTHLCLSATEPITDVSIFYPNRKIIGFDVQLPASGSKELAFVVAAADMLPVGLQEGLRPPPVDVPLTLPAINEEFDRVVRFWNDHLDLIQVHTPDKSFDFMVNRWYLYQVYSARLYARAGFYQVGGATGFRDQLQDVMGLLYSDPAYARRQILDHAAHQFPEGDVLHWWHESLRLGARTTFSDDYLWLVFVTYKYVSITGDRSILGEMVPFCQAEQLNPGEAERGMRYTSYALTGDPQHDGPIPKATLFEHLRLCMSRAMSRRGDHRLPLMGCGDWNDGMSRVGVGGKGESVWVAFFIINLVPKFIELTRMMPSPDEAFIETLQQQADDLRNALQENAWDGAWFLRAYFDNGDPMGSRNNLECQIDLISQAWAILTDVATPEQKQSIIRECETRLVNREHEIIQLLTPAFKHSKNHPGYIMDYPRGVRENGGQYTHGAMWYIQALLKEGRYDQAYYDYSIINPIHRTSTLADVLKYKVEPYCIAADIYSNPQHPGRGGWTWYTGSASWAYKTAVENILGMRKHGDIVSVNPRIPLTWNEFTIRYRYGSSTYIIHASRTGSAPIPAADTAAAFSNLAPSDHQMLPNSFRLEDDGQEHTIEIQI